MDGKPSNEITAIPELLNILALAGCIVTIDAMGCQTAIAAQVLDQGADYVLALKGNQETIHQKVAEFFDQLQGPKPASTSEPTSKPEPELKPESKEEIFLCLQKDKTRSSNIFVLSRRRRVLRPRYVRYAFTLD
jgi:hypothetical protein